MKLVCLPAEAELINKEGAIVRLPVKGRDRVVKSTRKLPGQLSAGPHLSRIYHDERDSAQDRD